MKTLSIIGILHLCFGLGAAGGQSLTEIAKKEKERREKNAEPVAVVDDHTLQGYEEPEDAEEEARPEDETASAGEVATTEASADAAVPDVPDAAEVAKTEASRRAERAACAARLARARSELNEQRRLLQQGVILWGETPTTLGGYTVDHPDGTQEIVGGVPGYTRYEQGRVSCLMATRNRSRYREAAATCDAIQAEIETLRAEIGAGCK